VIVDRLLAGQFVEGNGQEGSSSSNAPGPAPGPVRRVRFRPTEGLEQMEYDGIVPDPMPVGSDGAHHGGEMSRLSDEELCEQMASSGITAEPVSGSARGAALSGGNDVVDANEAALGEMVQAGGLEELRTQPVAVLASGALRLNARVIRTTNDLEPGYMSEKIVTKFIIECRQLSFRWEVARRYSEFHRFHELLALQWDQLPELPPKLLFSQECGDVAQRMMELDTYLRALLASPAVALSPLVCTFLDGIDVQSFRAQMLPRLQQMEAADAAQQRPLTVPTQEEAPNGW